LNSISIQHYTLLQKVDDVSSILCNVTFHGRALMLTLANLTYTNTVKVNYTKLH